MTKRTAHWRDIRTSDHLQKVLGIVKDADRPMTGLELQDEAIRRGFRIVNAGTDCWEIGQNEGHEMSGGVRFPDGKYRYWLIKAPGWTARWKVTKDFRQVPADASDSAVTSTTSIASTPSTDHGPGPLQDPRCPHCGAESGGGFCNDDHKAAFFAALKGGR